MSWSLRCMTYAGDPHTLAFTTTKWVPVLCIHSSSGDLWLSIDGVKFCKWTARLIAWDHNRLLYALGQWIAACIIIDLAQWTTSLMPFSATLLWWWPPTPLKYIVWFFYQFFGEFSGGVDAVVSPIIFGCIVGGVASRPTIDWHQFHKTGCEQERSYNVHWWVETVRSCVPSNLALRDQLTTNHIHCFWTPFHITEFLAGELKISCCLMQTRLRITELETNTNLIVS